MQVILCTEYSSFTYFYYNDVAESKKKQSFLDVSLVLLQRNANVAVQALVAVAMEAVVLEAVHVVVLAVALVLKYQHVP